jgi:hypothetical protein
MSPGTWKAGGRAEGRTVTEQKVHVLPKGGPGAMELPGTGVSFLPP